jgi:hypothetical protein
LPLLLVLYATGGTKMDHRAPPLNGIGVGGCNLLHRAGKDAVLSPRQWRCVQINNGKRPFCSVLFYVLWGRTFHPFILGVFCSIHQKSSCTQKRCSKDDKNEWVKTFCPAEHRTTQNKFAMCHQQQ